MIEMDVYKIWTGVHGPPHGPGPWTTPWTTPNFVKEIVSVNVKIYQRSGYEKHNTDLLLMSLRVCLVIAGCFGLAPPIT